MIASILVTRSLGPERYGIYSFYISVVSFVGLFFRFGVFNSAGLLLVHTDNEKRIRKLIGTAFILGLVIGVVYSLFLTLSSWFIDEFFKTNVGSIIRYTSLLLIFFPLYYLITHLSRGTKRVEILALM
ncbi:lipopolysaccharide biosynthesis protein, partial [Thermococcus sp. ES12]